jgi:hypothetical protein
MRVQSDYETEVTLAVYAQVGHVRSALQALRQIGVKTSTIRLASLYPGTYQCVDPSGADQVSGVLRGAGIGAPIGALLGLGMAVLVRALTADVYLWLAVAGCGAGALVGSMVGFARRARYDDDLAQTITVQDDHSALLVRVEAPAWLARTARRELKRTGAIAFLDPGAFPTLDHRPDRIDQVVA